LIYRFTLYSSDRNIIYSWKVKGWGSAGDGKTNGLAGPIAESAESAMKMVQERFVKSFQDLPELKRWTLDMPIDGAKVPQDTQKIFPVSDPNPNAMAGLYDSVVSVKACLSPIKKGDKDIINRINKSGLSNITISLTNEGSGQIMFDPTELVFITTENKTIDLVPGSYITALIATRNIEFILREKLREKPRGKPTPAEELAGLILGVALGAAEWGLISNPFFLIPLVPMGLAANASLDKEMKDLQENLKGLLSKELQKIVLNKGDYLEGVIFYPLTSDILINGELKAPIVDIDNATRYIVTILIKDISTASGQGGGL
jgi:hypothetical protein